MFQIYIIWSDLAFLRDSFLFCSRIFLFSEKSPMENAQIACLADLTCVQFTISVQAFSSQFLSTFRMVTISTQTVRIEFGLFVFTNELTLNFLFKWLWNRFFSLCALFAKLFYLKLNGSLRNLTACWRIFRLRIF